MIPAIIVGLLTAWYLGVRAGVIAAGLSFAAVIASSVVPGTSLVAYGVILAWCAAMYFFGPTMSKKLSTSGGLRDNPAVGAAHQVGSAVGWAKRALKRVMK